MPWHPTVRHKGVILRVCVSLPRPLTPVLPYAGSPNTLCSLSLKPCTDNYRHGTRLHGELAANVVRDSAAAVQGELLACYALIAKLGRSARGLFHRIKMLSDCCAQQQGSLLTSVTWSMVPHCLNL